MTHIPIIIVIGANSPEGSETARLGVAAGYEVFGFTPDGLAPTDEPWTHGVAWKAANEPIPAPFDALIVFDASLVPMSVASVSTKRVVGVNIKVAAGPNVVTIDTTGVIVERTAMAALRCAIEPDREGHFSPEEVDHIGDAMMLQ